MLKNFLAKLPEDVLASAELEDDKVTLHTDISPTDFYKEFQNEIESNSFTYEKAIFVASLNDPKPLLSVPSLLIHGR